MVDKASRTKREKEEQYFVEQEMNKRKALRKKLDEKRETQKGEAAKEAYWMKCPKCGGDLEEIKFEDVEIDKCKGCKGIYLDAGEIELLLDGRKAKGFLSKFMSSMSGSGD